MLRYFKKSETLCPGEDPISTSLHGVDSPVKVSAFIKRNINLLSGCQCERLWYQTSLKNFIADTYESIGVAHAIDMNGVKPIGCSEIYSSVYAGNRQWASQSYKLGLNANFSVITSIYIERVLIENMRALGV